MNERKRLIELFMQAEAKCDGMKQCEGCVGFGEGANCVDYLIVDHLLANGVIVPPCKVGDTLFVLSTCHDIVAFPADGMICPYENVCRIDDCANFNDVLRPFPMTVEVISIGDHGIYSIFFEESKTEYLSTDIGKTVFLTREDAEKALKEMR